MCAVVFDRLRITHYEYMYIRAIFSRALMRHSFSHARGFIIVYRYIRGEPARAYNGF